MNIRRLLILTLALMVSAGASAQSWPDRTKPIRFVVPFGAASSTDMLTRTLAKAITEEFGQPVVVENRPGAEGVIGVQAVQTAPPDGYTVLVTSNSTHVLNPHMHAKLPYDPVGDFTPVTTIARFSIVMNVSNKVTFPSAREFIEAARREPGRYRFGSGSATTRLAGELLQQQTGIRLLHVPYKSLAQAVTDLIAEQIDIVFVDLPTSGPHHRSGRIRPLAVTGPKRMAALPDVPTLQEQGVADYDISGWFGMFLPAGTPSPIPERLAAMVARVMAAPAVRDFLAAGALEPYNAAGAEFARLQAADSERWGRLIRAAGLQAQ